MYLLLLKKCAAIINDYCESNWFYYKNNYLVFSKNQRKLNRW